MNRCIFFIMLSFLVAGCSEMGNKVSRVVVAKAGNSTLYLDDIPPILQSGTSSADSTVAYQNYINRWVKRELLYQKANDNLSYDLRREIEKQVNETRANLVIYQYQRQMMLQKMDTIVTLSELEDYYNNHLESFSLRSNIVKALFIKIPTETPNIKTLENLVKEDNPNNTAEIETICYQNAMNYDDFNEEWITLDKLSVELPENIPNEDVFLKNNKFYEAQDSLYSYFVSFRDYKPRLSTAPFEYVKTDIERIILNNRRINFIQTLENDIYNDAINNNTFNIF